MSLITSSLMAMLPLAISAAKEVIDKAIDGADIAEDPVKVDIVRTGYCLVKIWGDELKDAIPGEIDDRLIDTFVKLCEDTAAEGKFDLLPT